MNKKIDTLYISGIILIAVDKYFLGLILLLLALIAMNNE